MLRRRNLIKIIVVIAVLGLGIPILFNYNFHKSIHESERRRLAILDTHGMGNDAVILPIDTDDHKGGIPQKDVAEMEKDEKKHDTRDKPATREKYDPPVLTPDDLGNYEQAPEHITGPGEGGKAVRTEKGRELEVNRGFADMGFNKVVSEMISLNRSVPDSRPPECKHWNYAKNLPTASVILIFLNEGWTTLLRTVHSVYNRSPRHLLKEIILLDDYSNKPFLKKPLEDYVKRFGGVVKVFRNEKREGLIRARVNGAKHATGDVIIFLDSHCEVNANWLPPLLAPILANPRALTAPVVDGIDDTTFEYRETYNTLHRGIFEWGFYYKENSVPRKERQRRKHETEPYRSPTHAGGLFAIGRKYFFELGAYDPHLETWGGENYELSFKLWQCGGEQMWVPCSHVGHIYSVRHGKPYHNKNLYRGISNTEMNYLRVVEVWFDDEQKEYFYTRIPQLRGCPVANIEEQLKFRRDHHCKSFTWFMKEIAYDVYDKFPPPPKNKFWGQFMMKANGMSQCWDAGRGDPILYGCHSENYATNNQIFRLNMKGQIGNGERCIDASKDGRLKLTWCTLGDVTGPWDIDLDTHLLRNTKVDQCVSGRDDAIKLVACDPKDEHQQWYNRETFPWKLDFPH